MAGRPSAYAALGLEPGADNAAIDRAYRDLIKRHHPDRAGGDARRAAEIIQAYRELRGSAARDALEFNDVEGLPGKPHFTWTALVVADAHSRVADPLFVPGAGTTDDYYTRPGSPARDAALEVLGESFCGSGPDIGFRESY